MLQHEAVFRFVTDDADKIFQALQPELNDAVNPRSTTCCHVEGADTLRLEIRSEDTAALRAALNMVLRLINIADEVQGLVKK